MQATARHLVYRWSLALLLILPQGAWAKSRANQGIDLAFASQQFKDTHALARAAQKIKKAPKAAAGAIAYLLEQKPQPLPVFQQQGQRVLILVDGKTHILKMLSDSNWLLNDRPLHLDQEFSPFPKSSLLQFILPEAAAAVPMMLIYAVVVTLVTTGGLVCINDSLTDHFSGQQIQAKWIRVDSGQLNRTLREIKNQLKSFCPGAAFADSNFDYAQFLAQHCQVLASNLQDPPRARGSQPRPPLRLASGEVNPAAVRNIRENASAWRLLQEPSESLLSGSDEGDRAIVTALAQDPSFIGECVADQLNPSHSPTSEGRRNSTSPPGSSRF